MGRAVSGLITGTGLRPAPWTLHWTLGAARCASEFHVNSVGEAALKKGGPYPDKTMFATDLHEFAISDGSYVEGARKGLAVMAKDSKKYASTGGWGFQLWAGGIPRSRR